MNRHYSYVLYIMPYIDWTSLQNVPSGFNSRLSLLDLAEDWSFTRHTGPLWCLE